MYALLFRVVILFFVAIAAVRIMGKRTIGELQASELVITMMISEIAAYPMQNLSIPIFNGIIPVAVLVFLEILLTVGILKIPALGKLFCGLPVIVISKGKIDRKAMSRLRFSCDDLMESLREKDVFDINEVMYAIMETDGSLSVMKKDNTKKNQHVKWLVISDGRADKDGMEKIGWSQAKLEITAKKAGYPLKEIFIMAASEDGDIAIIPQKEAK